MYVYEYVYLYRYVLENISAVCETLEAGEAVTVQLVVNCSVPLSSELVISKNQKILTSAAVSGCWAFLKTYGYFAILTCEWNSRKGKNSCHLIELLQHLLVSLLYKKFCLKGEIKPQIRNWVRNVKTKRHKMGEGQCTYVVILF